SGEVVPRPPRHGDRHGDHGLRRRRNDRRPAGEHPDELFQDAGLGRRLADVSRDGRYLLCVHDDRCVRLPPAADRLAAGRLDAAERNQDHDHAAPGAPAGWHKTRQFWLIWAVLCLNVSAGIGVIGMASPMLQEIFGGSLIGQPAIGFTQLSPEQRTLVATIAAGFTGLLSLFNIGGRFFWASLSDYIGRKNTYYTFFLLGIAMYA